jgi:hypothetical protein
LRESGIWESKRGADREFGGGRAIEDSTLDQPLADLLGVDAVAVVANEDEDVVAAVRGFEADGADLGLAAGKPDFGGLHAVVDGIAHQVHQRVAQFVDHALVEFGLLAADLQVHFLVPLDGDIAHHALEAIERGGDGHHAGLEHAALQAVRDARELVDRLGDLAEVPPRLVPEPRLLDDRVQFRLELLHNPLNSLNRTPIAVETTTGPTQPCGT